LRRRHWVALAMAVLMVGLAYATLSEPVQATLRYVSPPPRNFAESFSAGLVPFGLCMFSTAMLVLYVPASLVWTALVRWAGNKSPWWAL